MTLWSRPKQRYKVVSEYQLFKIGSNYSYLSLEAYCSFPSIGEQQTDPTAGMFGLPYRLWPTRALNHLAIVYK